MTSIGIDIGAKDLVASVRHKGKIQNTKIFSNTVTGYKKIIKVCEKYMKYGDVVVGMEATGAYYLDLAVALSNIQGLKVIVANPKATNAFSNALMERHKTDKVDSKMLAIFAEKMDYPSWEKPSIAALELRAYSRIIHAFTVNKAKAKNQLHALESFSQTPQKVVRMIKSEIKFLEKVIEKAQKEVIIIIKKDPDLSFSFELLQTIKGVGETSAIQILAETLFIPKGLTHRQWVAHAGLDPRSYQSGTSVHKKSHISKAGNRHLRKALFMPALSASKNDLYVNLYFKHLIEKRGLKKLQAIAAVMRKLLHAIHGMLLRKETFDNTRFFGSEVAI